MAVVMSVMMMVMVALVAFVFAGMYWLNQRTVRTELEPRRKELQALLASLHEEGPAGNLEPQAGPRLV